MTPWRESASLIILAKKSIEQCKKFNYNVLLFKRSEKSSFMKNHAVFPGGVFEKSDQSQDWLHYFQSSGITDSKLSELTRIKGTRPPMYKNLVDSAIKKEISLRITAIRETFEEVGLLLCKPKASENNDQIYSHVKHNFDRKKWQKEVHNDSNKFLEMCKELEVIPDLWSLHEWAAWLTPASFKKRFETAFYIVAVNHQPDIIIEENEVKEFHWNTPAEYFELFEKKKLWLPPPQIYELSRLSRKSDIEDVIQFAERREKLGTTLFLPVQYQLNDAMMSAYPGDDYYPENPEECKELIRIGENMAVINEKSYNIHRCCFEAFHKNYVEMNIQPPNGHIKPVTKSESLSKL